MDSIGADRFTHAASRSSTRSRAKAAPSASAGKVVRTITYSWLMCVPPFRDCRIHGKFSRSPTFGARFERKYCTKDQLIHAHRTDGPQARGGCRALATQA